jgi:hypothetical protein
MEAILLGAGEDFGDVGSNQLQMWSTALSFGRKCGKGDGVRRVTFCKVLRCTKTLVETSNHRSGLIHNYLLT